MPKKPTPKKAAKAATAIHAKAGDGTNFVGIGGLRVVIIHEGDEWFAQGLEIDYAAQGNSLKDVQKNFQEGLRATVQEHLKAYGTIEKILKVAPNQIWKEMLVTGERFRHSQISVCKLDSAKMPIPYESINYLERLQAA